MKDKLLKLIVQNIIALKSSSNDIVLDLNDDNKESVYNELLVPLMTITGSNSAQDLKSKLDTFLNGSSESVDYIDVATKFVNSLMEDIDETANLDDEVNNLIVNCVAVLNSFNSIIEKSDNKETSLDTITSDILTFMNTEPIQEDGDNSDTNGANSSDNNDEASDQPAQQATEPEPEVPIKAEEPPVQETVIVSATDKVDEGSWAEVNKIELKNMLKAKVDANEPGIENVINEVFALVKSADNVADWS